MEVIIITLNSYVMNQLKANSAFLIYLVLSTLFLAAQMWQGISFLDIGMYMSGYEHICDDPAPSVFLGQWLLSFVLSSQILHLFHANSFIAMRLMFLALTLILQCVTYSYLKRYIRKKYIIVGLGLTVLSLYGAYTEINYNDYSLLLCLLAILCYHQGISSQQEGKNKLQGVWIGASGLIIGVAFYLKITNLAWIILPFISCAITSITQWGKPSKIQPIGLFLGGWLIGMLGGYILVAAMGFGDIMRFTIENIVQVGGNSTDSHNLKNVFLCFVEIHKNEIGAVALIGIYTYFIYIAQRLGRKWMSWGTVAFLSGILILCIYLWEQPSSITNGICFLCLIICLTDRDIDNNIKYLFAISTTLPFLCPLGSNAGAAFASKGTCILSLPLAIYTIGRVKNQMSEEIEVRGYKRSVILSLAVVGLSMLYTNIKRPMMEDGNRLECKYKINSALTGNIRTTQENADIHNYLLAKVKPMLPKGSYLICNFSLTAVSLLECKPYAVYSTVFSNNTMNEKYLDYAYAHTAKLPYILDKPKERTDKDTFVIEYLIKRHLYQTIWSDGIYQLVAPAPTIPCMYIE